MTAHDKVTRNTLPGTDDITRVELPNGIVVLSRPNFSSLSVVVSGYIMTGSLRDPDEKLGLSQFTSQALMRGTANRDFQKIYDALESVGASLGLSSGVHSTSFTGHALAEDLPLVLDLLTDVLRHPSFPVDQVERLRAQLLTGLAIRAQDTQEMASLTFDQILFANHPYSRPEDGYPETVQAITSQDLVDFHRKNYGPQRMVIVVVGAVDPLKSIDQVTLHLGDWQNPDQPDPYEIPPLEPLKENYQKHVFIPGKRQADIVMGSNGPGRKSPDYIHASLGNNILGQFGMYGRIGDVVREQSGLAYYAYSSLNAGIGPGSWEFAAGVNPANLEKAIELIRTEIGRFVKEPVSSEELSDTQANYIGRLPLSLESNNGVAGALLNLERFELGLDYYRNYEGLVRSVTPESILETSQRYLDPKRLAVASAGPEGTGDGTAHRS